MGQTATIILITGLLLLGAIVVGATVFGAYTLAPDPNETQGPPMHEAVADPDPFDGIPPPPPPPVVLESGLSNEDLLARLSALEQTVARLEKTIAEERAATKPLREAYEQALAQGLTPGGAPIEFGGAIPEGLELVDAGGGPGGPKGVTDRLGLKDERATAFQETYARLLKEAKALEKEHAKVSVDGDTTTIEIADFGSAGENLRRSWDDWKQQNWTSEELTAYRKGGGDSTLFGARLGSGARKVEIRETAGHIKLTESSTTPDGKEEFATETMGPAIARDMILQDYAHLLK